MGFLKSVGNVLFGKKQTTGGFAPQTAEQEALDKLALGQAREASGLRSLAIKRLKEESGPEAVRSQIAQQERQATAGAADARRRLQELIARRGLKGSSVGLSQQVGLERDLARRKEDIRSQATGLRQLQTQRLLSAAGQREQFRGPQYMGPKQTRRTGGIAPLLGAAAGAYFGGPAGAQMGAGIGQAAQASF